MTTQKRLVTLGVALLACASMARWTASGASFASAESDYGSHVAIVNWLLAGPSWPPVYSGILGAHSLTAGLHLAGLSIPRAMLIVSDLGLGLLLVSIAWIVWPLGVLPRIVAFATVLTVSVPIFSTMNRDGYFGPLLSTGLYGLGIALLTRTPEPLPGSRLLAAALCFMFGAVTYPDGCMWCFPVLAALSFRSIPRRWWVAGAVLVAALEVALVSKQLELVTLTSGGGNLDWDRVIIVTALWSAALLGGYRAAAPATQRPIALLVAIWGIVCLLACCQSVTHTGAIQYYARKNFYFLTFLAPVVAATLSTTAVVRPIVLAGLLILWWVIPITMREPMLAAYARITTPRSHFDADDEDCITQARQDAKRQACKRLLVLPGSKPGSRAEGLGQRILRLVAANSYTQQIEAGSGRLRVLSPPLAESFVLADLLMHDPNAAVPLVAVQSAGRVDCYAVAPELLWNRAESKACLIVLNAESMPKNVPLGSSPVIGHHDTATCEHIEGWAWTPEHPKQHVIVEVLADGNALASTRAHLPRTDLSAAGIGDGFHGFSIPFPTVLEDGQPHQISVRIAGIPQVLPGGPKRVVCSRGRRQTQHAP